MHYLNLPTLVMMAAVAWCDESAILLFINKDCRSRSNIARISTAALCCIGISVSDYRLLVPGLLTAMPAVHLAGFAGALRHIAADRFPAVVGAGRTNILLCCVGLAITGVCATCRGDETWVEIWEHLQLQHVPILSVNAMATATAILLGQSILLPLDSAGSGHDVFERRDTIMFLLMTGATGLTAVLQVRRSYTGTFQFAFYGLALALIGHMSWIDRLGTRVTRSSRKVYQDTPSAFDVENVDGDDKQYLNASNTTRVDDASRRWTVQLERGFLGFILLPCIWIPYLMFNYSERIYNGPAIVQPLLDHGYRAGTAIEIVVNMYKEPVDEVAQLISTLKAMPSLRESRVHVYTKDGEANVEHVKQRTGANNVTTLPNIGREGHTYLYHILQNWDTMARQTIFLQAGVHNPREFYPRIRDYFDPVRTGMLSLGWSGQVCSCEDCGDRFGFSDTAHLFPEIHDRINNSTKCDNMLLSYKGQFVVSAKRVRALDQSVYRGLFDAFVNKDSWAHREEFVQGRPDSMGAPIFGYTVERMWSLLFQCNEMRVAWKCPSLLSGNRLGGSIEDCQCFDPVS
jgi:hypothetical protein